MRPIYFIQNYVSYFYEKWILSMSCYVFWCCGQLAGKVEPKEIQPGVGVAMVSGLLVASDNQYTLQVIHMFST